MNNSPSLPWLGSPQDHQHPQDQHGLVCPRCNSFNTKLFNYDDRYNLARPRHFCKSCSGCWALGTQRLLPPQVLNTTTDLVSFPSPGQLEIKYTMHDHLGTSSGQVPFPDQVYHGAINSGAPHLDHAINMPDHVLAPRSRSYPGVGSESHSHIQHLAQLVSLIRDQMLACQFFRVSGEGDRTTIFSGATRFHVLGLEAGSGTTSATALPTAATIIDSGRQLRANERNGWLFPLLDPSAATAAQVGLVLAQIYRGSGSPSLPPHAMFLLYISLVLVFIGFIALYCAQFLYQRRNREIAARLLEGGGIVATAFGFIAAMGMTFPDGLMFPVTIFAWFACSLATLFACTC